MMPQKTHTHISKWTRTCSRSQHSLQASKNEHWKLDYVLPFVLLQMSQW